MNLPVDTLRRMVGQQPYALLFATVSGAHLYGFPLPDSDFDLRGVHVLPARELLGLDEPRETIEQDGIFDGSEMDIVSHDVKKFFTLMLKKNGYVLEQLYSPLIVHALPEHEELKAVGHNCVTRHHAHHYFGFGETQWKLFEKERPRRVKPLLYTYRVMLTGIHLMRTGRVEANLLTLNEEYKLPQVPDLVARKLAGPEQSTLDNTDVTFHEQAYQRLRGQLQEAFDRSRLPDLPSAKPQLNDLLLRLREVVHRPGDTI